MEVRLRATYAGGQVRRPVKFATVRKSPSRVPVPVAVPRLRLASLRDRAHGAGVPTQRRSTPGGAEGTRTPDPHTARAAERGSEEFAAVHFRRSDGIRNNDGRPRTTVNTVEWLPKWHRREAA